MEFTEVNGFRIHFVDTADMPPANLDVGMR